MKGMIVHVLRSSMRDCTNGGMTSQHETFVLVGEGIPEITEARSSMPAMKLVKRMIGGNEYLHVEPVEKRDGLIGPMAGGNFIWSSDSRFPNKYPISVHDRFETKEDYRALSV